MRKIFKVCTLAIVSSIIALSLTACGGDKDELSPSEARDKLREQEMAKVIPLSEAFSEEGIWFFYEYADRDKTITKTDYVRGGILHFDGKGNATYYPHLGADNYLSFADLNDLSDEEIIKKAEELSEEAGKTPITAKFELQIKTDGTGNNTESEILVIGDKAFSFNTTISNQVVFDSTYSGVVKMKDSWFDQCLVRKVEEGHLGFRLDTPDTEGIKVD